MTDSTNSSSAVGASSAAADAPARRPASPSLAASGYPSFASVVASLTRRPATVYPGYLAVRLKQALVTDQIIESVADIQTIGDCRYALSATDHLGTRYRITVAVDDEAERGNG